MTLHYYSTKKMYLKLEQLNSSAMATAKTDV